MKIFKLIIKNALRNKLRALLTIVGIAIAVMAFGLLQTVVTAWNAGVEASAANRLIVRQAISFIFPLPYAYREQIQRVPGVENVSFFNWFGGVYIDKTQFFAKMACDPETLLKAYPEFVVSPEQFETFKRERNSCIIGEKLAQQYKLSIGDVMPIEGDIYPGKWEFVVRGIYKPRDKSTDATQMFFHWEYINERMKSDAPDRAGDVGWYVVNIDDATKSAEISEKVDALFKNSRAETKTETERAFQQGFVQSAGAILSAVNIMSFVIIGIIMLVLGNTMIMTARERTREFSVLRSLGFRTKHLVAFIAGESMTIAFLGGAFGMIALIPAVKGFEENMPKGFFPIFNIAPSTFVLVGISAIVVGVVASIIPIRRAIRTSIVEGLRHV